ncbi:MULTISPECIES: energy-coupled thiamine transporter ThiT [Paraclostridium]|uniref:Membrane protein n=1 Tax=Paraclostridium benzoelyticum TaxID=1629550 RepID=A0A0M3DK71_9FIRM|nr:MULTISPECIES: energy-coupled thiamine transporter ThiT [Paraclostridium]KKY02753.1 membrane protein [Paraclostridium benzoelyticum]MCU9814399.1 energy-coupled thiamine transporter ThiT [Paraclostridium sp. AKS73]MDM8127642.1 energy-coupled thiamine transporter ThiT [Paraclostridium benzoelyticum]OXX83592.1 energy-coupled thiamine transporter ThiT [Paraclostridium benzoelyticum]OXX83732.1 energy-coupled thiamine transporter ThiT [Paraclostridium benzoelyticum]
MINAIIILGSIGFGIYYLKGLKNTKFTTKTVVMIGMFSAISYILSMIEFIKYPQGGGISLFSMLPTMLLSVLFGNTVGITGGLIYGVLKLLKGVYIIHPAQFLLDYILPTMLLGLAGSFGKDKKSKVILGCLFAVVLSVSMNIISGCVFFGDYAPEGMNVFVYSFLYNVSSQGVEGLLSALIIGILPLERLNRAINASGN